jgi:hypothetical protein
MKNAYSNTREFAERYTKAWCSRDADAVASFFSLNGSLTINGGAPATGRAAIADVARSFMSAFPDLIVEMDGLSDRQGKTIYLWTLSGTNSGPGGSGRRVRISGFEEWQMGGDGLVADSQGHFDDADYRRQIEGAP